MFFSFTSSSADAISCDVFSLSFKRLATSVLRDSASLTVIMAFVRLARALPLVLLTVVGLLVVATASATWAKALQAALLIVEALVC